MQGRDLRGQDILLTRDEVTPPLGNKGLQPSPCSLVTYEMQVPPFPVVTYFKSEDGAIRATDGPLCSWITR